MNEAYLKLLGQTHGDWKNTAHFLAIASHVMRRILVDHARAKSADKRGREFQRVCLSLVEVTATNNPVNLIVVNDLLEKLEALNARHAKIVECRIFGGLTLEEIAETLSVSLATIKNDWRFCKAWLSSQMATSTRKRTAMVQPQADLDAREFHVLQELFDKAIALPQLQRITFLHSIGVEYPHLIQPLQEMLRHDAFTELSATQAFSAPVQNDGDDTRCIAAMSD